MLSHDTLQQILGLIAFIISLGGAIVYIRSILRLETKPHLFTWLIWSILSMIGLVAQIYGDAGPGAWAMGMTAVSSIVTAGLALKYGEKDITLSDKISLVSALIAILLWLATNNPLGSVILISIIDGVAFYPTIRKSWKKPLEENLASYNIANLKLTLSLFAMTEFSMITTLYPITIVVLNGGFVIMCLIRRKTLKNRAALVKTGA